MRRAVTSRWLWGLLLLAALAISLAYQVRQTYSVDVGGPDDCPYLGKTDRCPIIDNWHALETDPTDGTTYRWSTGISPMRFPGLGNQPLKVTLRLSGARPDAALPTVRVAINGRDYTWQPVAPFADQSFTLPRQSNLGGDLTLTLYPPTFTPPGDARELGVRVDRVTVKPAGTPLVVPDLGVIGSLLLAGLLLWLLVYPAGGERWALLIAGSGLLTAVLLLASNRIAISSFAPQLAVTLLWSYLIFWLVKVALSRLPAKEQSTIYPARGLAERRNLKSVIPLIVAAAFALRFGGMVYPQFITIDLTFHAHRIEVLQRFFSGGGENFYFQSILPNGTPVPYPSTYYLLLTPFSWLLGGGTDLNRLLVRFATALLDAGVVLVVYRYALRFGKEAAVYAAALYAVGPAVFQMLSQGNHSNLFAQAMFVGSLLCVAEVVSRPRGAGGWWGWLIGFGTLTSLTLLGHYGTALASLAVYGVIALVWLIFAPGLLRWRIVPLLVAGLVTLLLSYLLYYVHYNIQIAAHLGNILGGGRSFVRDEYDVRFDLPGLLGDVLRWQGWVTLPLGLLGIGLLLGVNSEKWKVKSEDAEDDILPAKLILLGWVLAGGLLCFGGLLDKYTVRYNIILLPALCICAGVALSWLAARSRPAGGVAVALGAAYLLWVWGDLVLHQYH